MDRCDREPFRKLLERNRVIPAVRDEANLKKALHSPHDIVFVLYGDLMSLENNVTTILRAGKTPFIHLDMVHGLANNPVVLDYFYRHFKRDCGIITTKGSMAKKALELGIRVIQRYFMLDSLSVDSAVEGIARQAPDAIEIMPGILPRIIGHISRSTQVPVIAGGLIQTAGDVEKILASGAVAISTTRNELWSIRTPSNPLSPVAEGGK